MSIYQTFEGNNTKTNLTEISTEKGDFHIHKVSDTNYEVYNTCRAWQGRFDSFEKALETIK